VRRTGEEGADPVSDSRAEHGLAVSHRSDCSPDVVGAGLLEQIAARSRLRAANTESSSSLMVSISTAGPCWAAQIRAVASTPPTSGIRRSITMTSGRQSEAAAMAASPSRD
jgi:hypothetical protein